MRWHYPALPMGWTSYCWWDGCTPASHQTVDEVHEEVLERLAPLEVRISRREILYLFDAYCTLLRASSEAKDDQQWLVQVEKNGGIIVSVDGIQPEKGNETVYVVRSPDECWKPCR
jgi:hypothetical protein